MPAFESCPGQSDTGAFRLAWSGDGEGPWRVQETRSDGTQVVLELGDDTATTVTGRQAGAHTYVLVAPDGTRSDPCVVEVAPPSLGLAFGLFGVGLAVTLATVALVVVGHRQHKADAR